MVVRAGGGEMQWALLLFEILFALPGRTQRSRLTVLAGTALAIAVTLAATCGVSARDASVFEVPPPTGDPAADLAAIKT